MLPDIASAFYAAAFRAAQEVLEAAGYHVLVVNTERTAARERAELQTLRAKRVVGLLVPSYGGYEDIGVPTVFFDDVVQGAGVGGVALDNAEGIRLLVEHLATTHGHARIAYIGPPETNEEGVAPRVFVGRERLEAFRSAMGDAGLPLPGRSCARSMRTGSGKVPARRRRAAPARSSPDRDRRRQRHARAGRVELTRELGIRVPDDLALVSFDEPPYAHLIDPPMTSSTGTTRSSAGARRRCSWRARPVTAMRRRRRAPRPRCACRSSCASAAPAAARRPRREIDPAPAGGAVCGSI